MRRKRLLVGSGLTLAIVIASTSVSWSRPVAPDGAVTLPNFTGGTGIAGPAGPQQISPVAAYFKRATFSGFELTQAQDIGAPLPAGRYLVEVRTPGSVGATDCLGVSFPLVPPQTPNASYSGFVTVTNPGDEVDVSCFQEPPDRGSAISYELFFIPVTG